MPYTRRAAIGLLAASTAAAAAGACGNRLPSTGGPGGPGGRSGGGDSSNDTFTVGLLNPTTGPFAQLGTDVNAAFEWYLSTKGGVLGGYKVKVVKEDETAAVDSGTTKARQLVEQAKVDMIVGLVNSAIAVGVAGYLKERGTPLLITVAGADALTQRAATPHVFRVAYTSSSDSMPLADYALKKLGYRTIAMIGLDYGFGWESCGGFAKVFTDGGGRISQELYTPLGTQDWGSVVQKINKAAEAVFITAPGADAQRFFQAYKDFGLTMPVLAHGSTTDEQLLQAMGPNAAGAFTSLHYSRVIDSQMNTTFRKDWEAKFNRDVNQYADNGWAAGQIVEAALANLSGKVKPEALVESIKGVTVNAPRGKISFDDRNQAKYPMYIRKVEQVDGKWANRVIETIPEINQFWTYGSEAFLAGEALDKSKGTWAR